MQTIDESDYDMEIPRIVGEIKKQKAKRVLLQFPDGLKPFSTEVVKVLKNELKAKKISAEILIWAGSCFGACDVPTAEAKELGVDLIVQFGHSEWTFEKS